MLCALRVSPAGISSYRGPVTVRCLKRDRIRMDAGVVTQALVDGLWRGGPWDVVCWPPVVTGGIFHDREDFGPEEWGKTLRDHGNRAAVPGRERAAPRSIRASHACGRPRRATCRAMPETRVILACLRGGVMAHKAAVDGARPTGRSGRGRAARARARGSGRGRVLGEEAEAPRRDAVSPRYPELSVQYPTIMCN
jgi:hypothetical protein